MENLEWIFFKETDIPQDITNILVKEEYAIAAYKTLRDIAIFTNKRIIIRDSQGLTGKKIEMYTIPYKSIVMYSTENSGFLDLSSEIEVWTKAGKFKIKLKKDIDVRKLDNIIASEILK